MGVANQFGLAGPSYTAPGGALGSSGVGGMRSGTGANSLPAGNPGPSPTQSAYDNYGTAAKTQANDYSNIMNKYNDLYNKEASIPTQNFNATAVIPTYNTSSDYKGAISNLSDLSKTGGYSAADIANMRARGVSPIRSVYANAQQDLQRQKALQGGYSPNLTAVTAKMAREMGSELSDAVTNVNAGIAQNQAANRISASIPLANTTAGEQDAHNKFNLDTAGMQNQFSLANLENQFKNLSLPYELQNSALGGMTSLYGTTPATTALMQGGALNQAQIQNQSDQAATNAKLKLAGMFGGG